jgi:hypothetical protein
MTNSLQEETIAKLDDVYPIHYYKPHSICLANIPYPHSFFTDKSHLDESIQQLQLYYPLYSTFFELSPNNYNSIGLNHRYHIQDLQHIVDSQHPQNIIIEQDVFIKFSPLLDPIKYMVGKYNLSDPRLKTLPSFDSTTTECHEKILASTNASYIDCFFCYLNSILKNHHHFVHSIDFYGSYLGIQDRYKMNVEEDLDYLTDSPFFMSNIGKIMVLENVKDQTLQSGSRCIRKKVIIQENELMSSIDLGIIDLDTNPETERDETHNECGIRDDGNVVKASDEICNENYENISTEISTTEPLDLVYQKINSGKSSRDSQDNDSDTTDSDTIQENDDDDQEDDDQENDDDDQENDDDDQEDNDDDQEDDDQWETDTESTKTDSQDENEAMVYIFDFPVQMICLEKCTNTLDSLFVQGMSDEEAASALFQVIMILLVYQKMFRFTHNDLHTNNIMYIETDQTYLMYKYQDKMYRVPTYGRIFKIIDFGRSIYKYQKRTFCSDSFASRGDASTQYNCEPFFKSSKPRLEPSMSFDLCRLGCSIYDFVFDDEDITKNEKMEKTELQRTIQRWCTDNKGKNILYKKNGQERYPGFQLYKMIARTVQAHTPENQLSDPWFQQFHIIDQEIEDLENVMNIDKYPVY